MLLEELTVVRARAGIEKLVHLTPRTARVVLNGKETVVPSEQVKVNDVIRVLPGETIPVDGVILTGQTSINQAVMTGESMPVDKAMANVIEQLNKPTLVIAHNKTLAAQLYGEFKEFFPENAVEYFVSYYDYNTSATIYCDKKKKLETKYRIKTENTDYTNRTNRQTQ